MQGPCKQLDHAQPNGLHVQVDCGHLPLHRGIKHSGLEMGKSSGVKSLNVN